ncbi:MAG: bidirectional hydrogenase complex protein HoxU [Kiritimatiellia bacterium]
MKPPVQLTINGAPVTARQGDTLMEAAQAAGIFIPGLCHCPGLAPVGACRLCLVEVKGVPRLLPACVTTVAEGMRVDTETDRLKGHRKMILELLFSERNHVCSVCVSNGRCELQALALRLGVTHTRFAYRYPTHDIDATHARFNHDPNRCILCTRCVRVCDEVEGARVWDVRGRGIHSDLITDLDEPWGSSVSCTSCGKCVNVCPTGALFEKGMATGEMKKRTSVLPTLAAMRAHRR